MVKSIEDSQMAQTLGLWSAWDVSTPTPQFDANAAPDHQSHPSTRPSSNRFEPISTNVREQTYLFKKLIETWELQIQGVVHFEKSVAVFLLSFQLSFQLLDVV